MLIILQTFLNLAKNKYVIGIIIATALVGYHLYKVSDLKSKVEELELLIDTKNTAISKYEEAITKNTATIANLNKELNSTQARVDYIVYKKDSEVSELKKLLLNKPKIEYKVKTLYVYPECTVEILKVEDANATNYTYSTIKSIGF